MFVTETDKIKTNGDKADNETTNGDKAICNEMEQTVTKAIVNGSDKVLNGDTTKNTDCDISSSDNTKLVSNGGSDLDDSKSSKSDDSADTVINVSSSKPEHKASKKKDSSGNKKNKTTDKADDKKKNIEEKKEEQSQKVEKTADKVNGDVDDVINGDKQRESSPSEDGDDKKRDAEVVFIQDLGFTVKIVSPGAEPLDIQVIFIYILAINCIKKGPFEK